MLNKLLSHGVSFGWTVRIAAFVALGCLVSANLFIRPRAGLRHQVDPQHTIPFKKLFTDLPYMTLNLG